MVLIDMEMPKRCVDCPLYSVESAGNGMWYGFCRWKCEQLYNDDEAIGSDCPFKEYSPSEKKISTNLYDQEEIHHNCTVQILRNSVTGDVSVGWWKEKGEEE